MKDSGGLLTEDDYYDIYSGMQEAVATKKTGDLKTRKAEADIANVENTIYNRNRNTDSLISDRANDKNDPKANIFADINEALQLDNEDGNPVIGDDGFVNPDFFDELISSAKEDGVSRADFLAEYGHLVNSADGRIDDYKLTQEEKDKLTGLK